ncbi:hypothetical protein AX16_010543 [Volvariella volvacea WC 439]|nr:hypothetical protein AX16_010543 [Volvariella volvacea WC 439]
MQGARAPRIKNRAPGGIQITAELLLREPLERQSAASDAPKQRIKDHEELSEYQGRKRKEFEERVQRTRGNPKEWIQYANWEASQCEFERSRSVYERALAIDPQSTQIWHSYTEMELKHRNTQHARNLFDRAVTLLPRADQLWYKYVYLEELLQNVSGARQAYIKFEQRYQELDRASAIFERWAAVRPEPRVWVKWAKFEEERGRIDKAREVFQAALEFFGEKVEKAQMVFSAFAIMETRLKEYERARVIYKFALDRIPRSESAALHAAYTKFEKQHGIQSIAENTVLTRRRIDYEEELTRDGRNYNTWLEYVRLEESVLQDIRDEGATREEEEEVAIASVREVYERAVAQVPPEEEKRHWLRYIFLWLNYAVFEEVETKDYARTRQVYQTAISVVPHKQFTFSKLWLMFTKFEIRRLEVQSARKILGTAIGLCPKGALFKGYIELEIELREFDRARNLYEKYLEFDPSNTIAWIQFAQLESQLHDYARARAIYELGVSQSPLSEPELLWKAYIDFEIEEGEREAARNLYERLISLSGHVKVWISYAIFEGERIPVPRNDREEGDEDAEVGMQPGDIGLARNVFEKGYNDLKGKGLKSESAALLEVWKAFEGPDFVFDDDEIGTTAAVSKFSEIAHAWKSQRGGAAGLLSGIKIATFTST